MADTKAIYAIAVAVFAGLAVIALTNQFATNTETRLIGEQEAYAQYGSIVGIRQNIITVQGSASSSVDPDLLVVSFGVETQATTASQATQENAQKMNAVVNAVMALGITKDDISTSDFAVYPIYDTDYRFITAYEVSNMVTVETAQLDKASQIIDTATGAGANRVNNVFFTLSGETMKKVSDQLIGESVKDAKSKAGLALEPLDMHVTGVKSVSLEYFSIPQPVPLLERAVAAEAVPTPIFESEQQVSMSVTVIFLIG